GLIGAWCEPSGQSGVTHRKPASATVGTTLRQRSPLTSSPCTKTTGRPSPRSRYWIGPAGRSTDRGVPSDSLMDMVVTLVSPMHGIHPHPRDLDHGRAIRGGWPRHPRLRSV